MTDEIDEDQLLDRDEIRENMQGLRDDLDDELELVNEVLDRLDSDEDLVDIVDDFHTESVLDDLA